MNSQTKKHTSTLPHYHIKKCVEYLYMSKKSSNFANKLVVESILNTTDNTC